MIEKRIRADPHAGNGGMEQGATVCYFRQEPVLICKYSRDALLEFPHIGTLYFDGRRSRATIWGLGTLKENQCLVL